MDENTQKKLFEISMKIVEEGLSSDEAMDTAALRDLKDLLANRVTEALRSVIQLSSNDEERMQLAMIGMYATLAMLAAAAAKKFGIDPEDMDSRSMARMAGMVIANIIKREEAKAAKSEATGG